MSCLRYHGLAAGGVLAGIVMALASLAVPASAGPAPKMPMAAGRITYQISGGMKGTMVLTWSESGKKYRQDATMTGLPPTPGGSPNAKPTKVQTWIFSDGKDLYTLMPMGSKVVMRLKGMKGMSGATGLGQLLGQAGALPGGKAVGKAKVLGQQCTIMEGKGGKVWLWKNIPLRAEVRQNPQAPKTTLVATKLEQSPKLSPSLFKVPAGYQVQDLDMSKQRMPGMPGQ